jgi:ribose transport system substrate-binding protein
MMSKYMLVLSVILMLAFASAGCGDTGPQTSAESSESTVPTTAASQTPAAAASQTPAAVNVKLLSQNAFSEGNSYRAVYEKNIQQAAAAAADKGLNVSYKPSFSNRDASAEAEQLEQAVNSEYDIMLVNPVEPTGLDSIIDKALDAGIIYINCGFEYDSDKILNIATDQYYLGYKAAAYVGDVLGPGGRVVLLNGIKGNAVNEQRAAGFAKGIEEKGLVVVEEANHDWDSEKAEQVMTKILDSGIEFDGVLTSQCAGAVLKAYEDTNTPWPKAIGFGDSGEYMQMMLRINKDSEVLPYIVISDPPGVGATALNFGLNLLLGNKLKDDVYSNPQYHTIYLPSKIWYTYDNQEDYREIAESTPPEEAISYWLTMDEVKEEYFQ